MGAYRGTGLGMWPSDDEFAEDELDELAPGNIAEDADGFGKDVDADFKEFVARTADETSRLAFLLTGDAGRAASLVEHAYADMRPGFRPSDEDGARRQVRTKLVARWSRQRDATLADLDVIKDKGWPSVRVSQDAVADEFTHRRTRRGVIVGALALAGLGLGAWGTRELILGAGAEPGDAATSPTPTPTVWRGRRAERVVEAWTVQLTARAAVTIEVVRAFPHDHARVVWGSRVLAQLPLGAGDQMARAVNPWNWREHLVLVTSGVSQFLHLDAGQGRVWGMRQRSLGEQSIGVALIDADTPPPAVVRGLSSGVVTEWPSGTARGVRFGMLDIWAYLTDRLTAAYDRELASAGVPRPGTPQIVRFRGGIRVYCLEGPQQPRPTLVQPRDATVELRRTLGREGVWMALVVGPAEATPSVTWTDSDGLERTVSLA
ncbi:hypothetical protein ACQB6R_08065 [Propionibacteriaceae bacterium G1746]|uniref:hypothetical protein n=1 Tax=Aestuariimicrobium sp. G57 TaxID=3418485 RepID=UPI003C18A891